MQVVQEEQEQAVWLLQFEVLEELAAQGLCGKMGSEKNSSQTFSANSSQGGTEQKP